jgi:hypothetical protein
VEHVGPEVLVEVEVFGFLVDFVGEKEVAAWAGGGE